MNRGPGGERAARRCAVMVGLLARAVARRHAEAMTTKGLLALTFLLPLTSCIAAIGNTGADVRAATPALRAIGREKLEVAERIVTLRERQRDDLRLQHDAGRVDARAVLEAEIQLEEARLRLLELRAEVAAAGDGKSS